MLSKLKRHQEKMREQDRGNVENYQEKTRAPTRGRRGLPPSGRSTPSGGRTSSRHLYSSRISSPSGSTCNTPANQNHGSSVGKQLVLYSQAMLHVKHPSTVLTMNTSIIQWFENNNRSLVGQVYVDEGMCNV